mgnify:CR=1 FL=1
MNDVVECFQNFVKDGKKGNLAICIQAGGEHGETAGGRRAFNTQDSGEGARQDRETHILLLHEHRLNDRRKERTGGTCRRRHFKKLLWLRVRKEMGS